MAAGPAAYRLDHRGHRFELTAGRGPKGTVYRLLLDGRQVAEQETTWRDPRFVLSELDLGLDPDELGLGGGRVVASSWRRGRISSCNLVLPANALKKETATDRSADATTGPSGDSPGDSEGDEGSPLDKPERIPFEPPAGTRAHRAHVFKRDHPKLYAARHLVIAVGEVVVALVGIRIAIGIIPWDKLPFPDLDLPSIDLPSIPWPDIDWPDLDLPDIDWPSLPGWVTAILDNKQFWLPILIAVFATFGEVERRRKRREREAEVAARQAKAADYPTAPAGPDDRTDADANERSDADERSDAGGVSDSGERVGAMTEDGVHGADRQS